MPPLAAHLEPDILIIDEVLAVGDVEFQKKCLGKMNDASRREGRTVLLVSHNMGIVNALCPRVIWLDRGSVQADGSPRSVIDDYLVRAAPNQNTLIHLGHIPRPSLVRDERFRLKSLEWLSGLPLRHGEPVKIRIHFEVSRSVSGIAVAIGICNREGIRFLNYDSDCHNEISPHLYIPSDYWVDLAIDSLPLGPDIYILDVGCRSGDNHILDFLPACAELEVISGSNTPGYISRFRAGAHLRGEWVWNFVENLTEPQTNP
jgi:homopolymeric O-antigen transport system ATP-binding protein